MSEDLDSKTKLILSIKAEVADVKQNIDDHKQQIEKFHKKLAQVLPTIDGVKDACSAELTKLRDELNEESQILMKVVAWIRDKLDTKIDKKLETAREEWLLSVQKENDETATKIRKDFNSSFDEEKEKWEEKLQKLERAHAEQVDNLKDGFAKNVADLKDQWNQERSTLESKIQTLENEHKEFLQSKISGLYTDAQSWVAAEAEKVSSAKAQQLEAKLSQWQSDQDKKLHEDLQKSGDHFRDLWKTDLELLRTEEAALWEKERRSLREDERKFRESIKESVLEEIKRFQTEALDIISAAQEELAKTKAQSIAEEASNGGQAGGDDELFEIGKKLTEKHTKREKDKQTKQILISPDSLLKRIDFEEKSIETEQERRDSELKKRLEKREKV